MSLSKEELLRWLEEDERFRQRLAVLIMEAPMLRELRALAEQVAKNTEAVRALQEQVAALREDFNKQMIALRREFQEEMTALREDWTELLRKAVGVRGRRAATGAEIARAILKEGQVISATKATVEGRQITVLQVNITDIAARYRLYHVYFAAKDRRARQPLPKYFIYKVKKGKAYVFMAAENLPALLKEIELPADQLHESFKPYLPAAAAEAAQA